jgi:hypothetical protein
VTTARKTDPIRKIIPKNGETRYRFIIDMGKRPDGKRDQRCYTHTKLGEAWARPGLPERRGPPGPRSLLIGARSARQAHQDHGG